MVRILRFVLLGRLLVLWLLVVFCIVCCIVRVVGSFVVGVCRYIRRILLGIWLVCLWRGLLLWRRRLLCCVVLYSGLGVFGRYLVLLLFRSRLCLGRS